MLDATNFPIRATEGDTYNLIIGADVIGNDAYPWFHVVSDEHGGPWKEGWIVVLREREDGESEPTGPEYTITHEKVWETALKLAASDLDIDERAKFLQMLIDPDEVELDDEHVDRLLQMAMWGTLLHG